MSNVHWLNTEASCNGDSNVVCGQWGPKALDETDGNVELSTDKWGAGLLDGKCLTEAIGLHIEDLGDKGIEDAVEQTSTEDALS